MTNTYPIVCAPMNRVSDLTLALAVHESNCIPSFVIYNYQDHKWDDDFLKFKTEVAEFISVTDSHNFVIALKSETLLLRSATVEAIIKFKPQFVEIFDIVDVTNSKLTGIFKLFRKLGIKVIYKLLGVMHLGDLAQHIDGVVIKGPDSAGRVAQIRVELTDKIAQVRRMYPHFYIIASGGITTAQDITECIAAGANVVSIGTLFGMSIESSMALETKQRLLSASFAETQNIGQEHQNAIVFSQEADVDGNHTMGLEHGVRSPESGHVFVGRAIDSITEIKSVKQVVQELTAGL